MEDTKMIPPVQYGIVQSRPDKYMVSIGLPRTHRNMRAYLEIDIGDTAAYATALAAYQRAVDWLAAVGAQYGLTGKPEELDADGATLLREAYVADPSWAGKGEVSTVKPAPVRAGRIVVELFDKEVPKTVENFRCLLTGEKGLGKASKKPLHYRGTKFHRIVKGFCCQGGDVVRGDGSGGDSIYGGQFNDEKQGLKLKHDGPGVLSMANSGKNTNTSQFFFTLAAAPQCDGKHVVLGKVLEGLDILARIDAEAASQDGNPRLDVTIADCGTC